MAKKITAFEFLQNHNQISHFYSDKEGDMVCFSKDVEKAMIDFAKYHVEEASKVHSRVANFKYGKMKGPYQPVIINRKEILESYPLDNIK